jgi:mevalonate kinase
MKLRISQQPAVKTFYGHGKLLITGEYFVLDGARALAVPTKLGQTLRSTELHSRESILYWVALNNQNKQWLNLVFDTNDFSCINSQQEEAKRLSKLLSETRKLNPEFLAHDKDIAVETRLEFPNEWGLGSSSTLIYCLAKWAEVDAYQLLQNTLGGSGYDVACAGVNSPVLYELIAGKPETLPLHWNPPFSDNLYFAYTGQKQLSSEAINYYRTKLTDKTYAVSELSRITGLILKADSLEKFEELINEHEQIVGSQLKMIPLHDTLFSDYWGAVKWLGAWGGDFVLLANKRGEDELKAYLTQKNITIVFGWKDLILSA